MASFNLVRQMLALSIGVNSYNMIKKKKYISDLISMAIAFYIYNSAAVLLVLFLVNWMGEKSNKQKKFKHIVICDVCLLIGLNVSIRIIEIIMLQYTAYFKGTSWTVSIGGTVVLWIVELFMIFYMFKKKFNKSNSFEIATLVTFYLTLECVALRYRPVNRMALHFRAFLVLIFPTFIEYVSDKNRWVVRVVLFLLRTISLINYISTDTRKYLFFWQ